MRTDPTQSRRADHVEVRDAVLVVRSTHAVKTQLVVEWLEVRLGGVARIHMTIDKQTLSIAYFTAEGRCPLLREQGTVQWQGDLIKRAFAFDDTEHFTGLGHGYFGRAQSIDLTGPTLSRNYGTDHADQAPLLVPF